MVERKKTIVDFEIHICRPVLTLWSCCCDLKRLHSSVAGSILVDTDDIDTIRGLGI